MDPLTSEGYRLDTMVLDETNVGRIISAADGVITLSWCTRPGGCNLADGPGFNCESCIEALLEIWNFETGSELVRAAEEPLDECPGTWGCEARERVGAELCATCARLPW